MSIHNRPLRIAIAGFHLESASFLPRASTRDDFEAAAYRDTAILNAYRATNTVPGGFISVCETSNVEIVPLVYTFLGALGPATDDAVQAFADEIARSAANAHVDGVLLHLHGACWSEGQDDVERFIIGCLRHAIGPDIPVVVAFDYHGNIDINTVSQVQAAYAYHHSPHTDMGETGCRAGWALLRILQTGERPYVAVAKPGLIVPSIFSATVLHPLSEIIALARTREALATDELDISIMAGFSYADAHNTGFSVLVVSWQGESHAQSIANEFSARIVLRQKDIYAPEPVMSVDAAIRKALASNSRSGHPIVLLEHADRMNDSTYILNALLDQNVQRAYVPFLWDTAAAHLAFQAGIGNEIEVALGGWSSDKAGHRRHHQAQVLAIGRRKFHVSGAMLKGQQIDLGMTALLKIRGVMVSVVSNFAFTIDQDVYKVFDLDLKDFDIIVLRSKTHFRQYFAAVASEILIVDTPDYGPADLTMIPYRRLKTRSVYPLNKSWPPSAVIDQTRNENMRLKSSL